MKVLRRHKIIAGALIVEVLCMIAVAPVSSPDEPAYVGIVVIPFTLAVWGVHRLIKRLGKRTCS